MKFSPITLPPADTFRGQTAVVTGGTSGLGLAAAIHLVNLGAREVIISSRDPARAQTALEAIDRGTGGRSSGKVRVLALDMESYASVVAFVGEVRKIGKGKGGVDVVILNAGVIGTEWKKGPEGWDQNLQINTLSTILLALLLLPHFNAERANRSTPAHLTFASSMAHANVDIDAWGSWKGESVLEHLNRPENFPGMQAMYASTKLLLEYAIRELMKLKLASDEHGRPAVIINHMCPGIVKTDLSRHARDLNPLMPLVIGIYTSLFSKSPENGARTYMAAVTTTEEDHGKFIQFYVSEKRMAVIEQKMFTSTVGRKLQAKIWAELTQELAAKVPGVKGILMAD